MSVRTTGQRIFTGVAAAVLMTLALPLGSTTADAHSRSWRHHHSAHVVDAPFTRVETRRHRTTSVWAPFTRVHVSRRGTYVRAPFVDLFVPR